jgi:hypothetical protein
LGLSRQKFNEGLPCSDSFDDNSISDLGESFCGRYPLHLHEIGPPMFVARFEEPVFGAGVICK